MKPDQFHSAAVVQPAPPPSHAEQMLQSLFVMAWFVEARDPYTGGHLWRVSQFSRLLAEHSGLASADVARIALGGFLHDLGKVGVPDAILRKPDRLTDDEYTVIKTHPEVGARLLAGHPLAELARSAILHHHETPDGTGYPHRLAGHAIPIDARIVGICDAFDAMTSTRPYRRGMPVEQALEIIERNLDRQFDGRHGEHFLALGRAGVLHHVVGHSDHGIPLQPCPMCGPTIVVRRNQKNGDVVYCRNCGGEAVVERDDHHLTVRPTGNQGAPGQLEPEADLDIIGELVHAASGFLATQPA
jgi:hypothetical protein